MCVWLVLVLKGQKMVVTIVTIVTTRYIFVFVLSNIFATLRKPVKWALSALLILAIATIKGRKNSLVWQ